MWNGTPDQCRDNAIRASVGGSSFGVDYHRFLLSPRQQNLWVDSGSGSRPSV